MIKFPYLVADKLADLSVVFSYTAAGYHIRKHLWEYEHPDMYGKVCVITGANSGIGKAAAKALACTGCQLVLICRNRERGQNVCEELKHETGNSNIALEIADLSSLTSISDCAQKICQSYDRLDVLINNAGVMLHSRELSSDGFEKTFATNVLGGFFLTHLLADLLIASAPSRVIHVSSGGMYTQKLDVNDLEFQRKPYDGVIAYAQTKRAQVILNEMLAEKFGKYGVASHCMHPGWAATPGVKVSLPRFHCLLKLLLRNSSQGADTLVWLATTSKIASNSGKFWFDRRIRKTHIFPHTRSTKREHEQLWEECVKRCEKDFFAARHVANL